MSTLATPSSGDAGHQENYLNHSSGIMNWLITLDHKRIGVMYTIGTSLALLLGGVFALALRTELLTPGKTIMDHDTYNQMFTLHGAVMVFLFIIPSIPAALGNFVLPIMLGQKDVVFPRLNLASFYIWLAGAAFMLYSLFVARLTLVGHFTRHTARDTHRLLSSPPSLVSSFSDSAPSSRVLTSSLPSKRCVQHG